MNHSPSAAKGKALSTPDVRNLAKTNDIDISTVIGTGADGRVLKTDVEKLIKGETEPKK